GVKPDGSPTVGMPWELHDALHPEDLGKIIAFLRNTEAVDTDYPDPRYGVMLRLVHVTNFFPLATVETVDINDAPSEVVSPDDLLAWGKYLSVMCTACHGEHLGGNSFFGTPNITSHESALGNWTESDLTAVLRTGTRPDGSVIDPEQMPWREYSRFTD